MKNYSYLIVLSLLVLVNSSYSQPGGLYGKIIDKSTKETIPFANIVLTTGNHVFSATTSDIDGKYTFDPLPDSVFSVKVSFIGYKAALVSDIQIKKGKKQLLNIELESQAVQVEGVVITKYKVPLIDKDRTVSGSSVTSGELITINNAKIDFQDGRNAAANPEAMKLTASELNDFSKWDLWQDIQHDDLNAFQKQWMISPTSRYMIQLMNGDNRPVIDATIILKNPDGTILWSSRTDNTGKAELWADLFNEVKAKKPQLCAEYKGETYYFPKPNLFSKGINVLKIPATCFIPEQVDIAFVVDATGSMDDEIDFLQLELVDIIQKTKRSFPDITLNLGSVFYRCFGNSYVTRISPLSTNIDKTINFIKLQDANEGGDEVVEEAFGVAVDSLGWSKSARTRLLFFVMDEQPLTSSAVITKMQKYIRKSAEKGIRVIPVIASAETPRNAQSLEYLMRSVALATNGTYVFLTDHSKIGNKHAKPTTDQYDVELLNNLMQRIIYQFCYVPGCDEKLKSESSSDTTYVTDKVIIAHEVIDSLRTVTTTDPKLIVVDYTVDPVQDTLKNGNPETIPNTGTKTELSDVPSLSGTTGLKFYPNPTNGIITVESEGEINELFLTDFSGKLLAKYKISGHSGLKVDLSNYSTGVYFLRYIADNRWYAGKVILTR